MQLKPLALAVLAIASSSAIASASVPTIGPAVTTFTTPPTFDGLPLSSRTITGIVTPKAPAEILGWSGCAKPEGTSSTSPYFDHCLQFSIGTADHFETYVLGDTHCSPSATCYLGYQVLAYGDSRGRGFMDGGIYKVTLDATLKLGVKRYVPPVIVPGSTSLPGYWIMFLQPLFELHNEIIGHSSHVRLLDAKGTLISESYSTRSSAGDSEEWTCEDEGNLVTAGGNVNAAISGALVTAAVAGMVIGISAIATGGVSLVILGAGVGIGGTVGTLVGGLSASHAAKEGLEAKKTCIDLKKLDQVLATTDLGKDFVVDPPIITSADDEANEFFSDEDSCDGNGTLETYRSEDGTKTCNKECHLEWYYDDCVWVCDGPEVCVDTAQD